MAVAKTGQPWSEVMAMSPLTRKAFLYCHAAQEGYDINWTTGAVKPPKPKGAGK